jgi:hypothetical protein
VVARGSKWSRPRHRHLTGDLKGEFRGETTLDEPTRQ